ncbi:MAG: ribosome biogenesis/translation initiation ATPase RLI [Methanomassiliicoccaceae archaeon]|jgi:ATP-binding cassette subfamily E protein 1|nr:ribosome biogenesis/translation initiation ATPase RLI [Euryarchaeota archaeon]HOB38837.1 ribosome biogenesis/translation initiation ATPase RLI [Methanomassiliicoccaceae archaeon]HQA21421.1 ribosome biogenesis/translation initiation ATPase RLI [Methanomassiliicoccaceae archaeon]HQD88413.1 ribosome biogenesis/translation initiation ATPase RLI [Methanomassiliicoccaceae archaeon]
MRIAVLLRDRCQPKKCNAECRSYCPKVRTGVEAIVMGEGGRPIISEELCAGCGICINKCPFEAIKIIGLPEEIESELMHQYGQNGFRIYRLPVPKTGLVTGILGPNGIGKTTSIGLLSGREVPNFGQFDDPPSKEEVLDRLSGTELGDHLVKVYAGQVRTALKPQYVDKLPAAVKGVPRDLLGRVAERMTVEEASSLLDLDEVIDRPLDKLSGGELQRVAIAATLMKDADIYFFDEPSSYLDIFQRIRMARLIQELAKDKQVMVIEHDLAILDFMTDNAYLVYGSEGAYGVFAQPRHVRTAINTYLDGYMREENIRFRDTAIRFESHPPRDTVEMVPLMEFGDLECDHKQFKLKVEGGTIRIGESVGVVGPNAIGKTTFVKMLAGVQEPTKGKLDKNATVSYKPQYISPDFDGTVSELFMATAFDFFQSGFFESEIAHPLSLRRLYEKNVMHLSGGELQRVAIALCLSKDADIYLLDEPSAYLDSNQRMEAAKTIRRVMEKKGRSALIVDHDIYFLDMVSDSMMVFSGTPGVEGLATGPYDMRQGMNMFLKAIDVTFRRDNDTNRPRINKPGSRLDREQKEKGEYYYS